jgi:hypothetical protein
MSSSNISETLKRYADRFSRSNAELESRLEKETFKSRHKSSINDEEREEGNDSVPLMDNPSPSESSVREPNQSSKPQIPSSSSGAIAPSSSRKPTSPRLSSVFDSIPENPWGSDYFL